MKKQIFLILTLGLFTTFFKTNEVQVKAQSYELDPIAAYEFNDEENLGLDSCNNFNLKSKGNVTKTEDGIKLDGSSYLYYEPLLTDDFTDSLESFTITCWAKEDAIGAGHRFMIGTGVAYSSTGLGMGFYSTNSAYIVPVGGADNYASNFVTSANDTFGPYATDYAISTEWNLYTLMLQNGTSYFGVNGHLYELNVKIDMKKIANNSQTFTIGGVCNNKGQSFYNGFTGEISDVRVYNGLLTAEEFSNMYSAGKKGSTTINRETSVVELVDKANENYDFEVVAAKFANSDMLDALDLSPTVKLSNTGSATGNLIWSNIDVKGSEAIATGLIIVNGVAGALKVKAHITKGGSSMISLNTTFTDHMVLQRNKKVKIFGYGGDEGEEVTVTFNGQEKKCKITEDGWEVYLDAMTANSVGQNLVVTCGSQVITLEDVVVGEVLLCSGQSNMAITVQYIYNKDKSVILSYSKYDNYENVRVLDIPYATASEPQIYDKSTIKWKICNSLEDSMTYSAYAMTVASNYQALLGDVVVGVITASVGGSCIEEWLDKESLKDLTSYAASMNKVDSQYYNSMIYNLKGYTISGIVWYQGEANSQPRMVEDYRKQFKAYAALYRNIFENEELPIIVQQLVQFDSWCETYQFREMQWNLMDDVSNVYTVCGYDTGSMEVSDGIHATDKWVLGGRVAGLLAYHYGISKDEYSETSLPYGLSPEILSGSIEKVGDESVITIKTNADGKLHAKGTITGFQVVYGGEWKDVDAEIVDGSIVIHTAYLDVTRLRYNCFTGYPNEDGVYVYNEENLPLVPHSAITLDGSGTEEKDISSSASEEPKDDSKENISTSSEEESSKYKETTYDPNATISTSEKEETSEKSEEPTTKKGCGGSASSILSLFGVLTCLFIKKRKA